MSLTRRPGIRPQRSETLSGLGTRGGSGRLRQNPPRRMDARPTGGFFSRVETIVSNEMHGPGNGPFTIRPIVISKGATLPITASSVIHRQGRLWLV